MGDGRSMISSFRVVREEDRRESNIFQGLVVDVVLIKNLPS